MCTQYGSVYGRKLVAPAESLFVHDIPVYIYSSVYLRISHARLYRDMTKEYRDVSYIAIYHGTPNYRLVKIHIYKLDACMDIVTHACLHAS